ncbi:O-antigen ligase family protein [Roseiflexus sp.]|uniref:O-antigen ligase family protein n=1 Tax=Roseiflexus sp. TaxID=2562120 RepID=UPI00398B4BA9
MSRVPQTTRDHVAAMLSSSSLAAALAAVVLGLAGGAAVAFGPFWLGFVALAALIGGYALLIDTRVGLAAVIGIATIIPFATLPFRAVVTPALLTLALAALMGVWLLRLLVRSDERLLVTPVGMALIGFLGITLFAFLLGSNASPEPSLIHNYAKFAMATLFFFSVVNCVRDRETVRWVMRFLIIGAALSAVIALALYIIPDRLALQILVSFGRIGYPTEGRVLRYVEDDPNGLMRAIGLSVDPNSFGGMLALIGALAATQMVSERPVLSRRILIIATGTILLTLFLTYSRAALGGIIVAAMYVATLRYRRLWWVILAAGALAAALFIGLGVGERFVERVVEGVQFRDRANQMRLAEYQNAIAIIRAYPVFGIGFGQAPELDLVAGVSSIYLAIAQRTGLVGLAAFLGVISWFFARNWNALRAAVRAGDEERVAWLVSLQAALAAALAVGLLDHYFFNIEFSHMSALFWGAIGLAVAVEEMEDEER